ncbi:MAG TPA: hypothetical protein VF731_09040 [Solirubrobacterales bacterium]
MFSKSKLKPVLAALLIFALALAIPAAAQATLAYVKYGRYPSAPLIFTAADDGFEEIAVARGNHPEVSPDGEQVAYLSRSTFHGRERLKVVPAAGGASDLLLDAPDISYVTWSPDSSHIAAVRGVARGRDKLVLIDVATGGERVLARGTFGGVSFSPSGEELVVSRTTGWGPRSGSDVFRLSTRGGRAARLTFDHRSRDPLWGPGGQIAFVKEVGRRQKNHLFLMHPDGGGIHRLDHTRVGRRQFGLVPVDWSADGGWLLADFRGPRSTYAVVIDPATRAQWAVRRPRKGFVGSAFSCNGTLVLGSSGPVGPIAPHLVGAALSEGGRMSVLAEYAYEPDWNQC